MPLSLIPSFLFYCLVSGITPGPANLCSLAAALKYGKKQALNQWKGLFTGYVAVSFLAVLFTYFLGAVMQQYVTVLSYIGAAYILWLAFHILKSGNQADASSAKSCNFATGLMLQATNAKVIVFCITALSAYVLPYSHSFGRLLLVGMFLPLTGPSCNLIWLFAGLTLQKYFERYSRVINIVMALSLVVCAISLLK